MPYAHSVLLGFVPSVVPVWLRFWEQSEQRRSKISLASRVGGKGFGQQRLFPNRFPRYGAAWEVLKLFLGPCLTGFLLR